MAGGATLNACRMLIPRIVKIGAHLLKSEESQTRFEAGRVISATGTVGLDEITEAWYLRPERLPTDADRAGLEASVAFKPKVDTGAFSYASHAVAVAVDTDTGHIEILDYVIVEDCGTLVNPMVVEGQTLGGVAQGIGTAMYEEMQYDANGQPNASTFADYLLPGATEVPALRIFHIETPSPYTEFGIKGMGEGGAIAPPAVIINAVNNALTPMGVEITETPVTPERVLDAIEKAKSIPKREAA
jgi:carbon-monoxide dehydrogenase large subunit